MAFRLALLLGICACKAATDLLPRDCIVNGIDRTILAKSAAKSAFTYTLKNATQPGTNDLVITSAAGYHFGLPWWTGIPAAILNLLIALRLFIINSWRWKGKSRQVQYKNKQTQPYWQDSEARQRELDQTEALPDTVAAIPQSIREWCEMRRGARPIARPEPASPSTRTPSPITHGLYADSTNGDEDDKDKGETPPYVKITVSVFCYLQLAYLFIQVIAGLAYIVIGSDMGPAGRSVGALRYAGPASYSLLLGIVCQVWSSLFLFFSPHVGRLTSDMLSSGFGCREAIPPSPRTTPTATTQAMQLLQAMQ